MKFTAAFSYLKRVYLLTQTSLYMRVDYFTAVTLSPKIFHALWALPCP